jgi:hypothetical protein
VKTRQEAARCPDYRVGNPAYGSRVPGLAAFPRMLEGGSGGERRRTFAISRAPEPEGRFDAPSEQVWREGGSQLIRRSNEDEAGLRAGQAGEPERDSPNVVR